MSVPTVEIAPGYRITRVVNGGWQLSQGHGAPTDIKAAVDDLLRLADAGFTTFDCADIYTGVEELFGRFLKVCPQRSQIRIHTKFVPDRDRLPTLDWRYVERIIHRSLERLGVETLDLVQFHWWDWDVPGYVEIAGWLEHLRGLGKIRHLGATNFDTPHLREVVEGGVPIAAHQVQYSLLDRRPERAMTGLCTEREIHLLTYGSLAGGFLSERWVGASRPTAPVNRSLVKYALIIEEFGGWGLFQELLRSLAAIADKHGVSISNVASRWVLERPGVAAVIIGARSAAHVESNLRLFDFELDDEDRAAIDAVLAKSTGPAGDCFELERMPGGQHAKILKTNLNREGS